MKKEIVYTDKYALILSDEEITEQTGNDTIFNKNLNAIVAGVYDDDDNQFKVLAHLPLSDAPILEGVLLLPQLPQGDDVDIDMFYHKQVMNPYPTDSQSFTSYEKGFVEGYNKAKEKYKYTEEDVRKAISLTRDGVLGADEIIQSLQQLSRPTHFECEMDILNEYDKIKTTTNKQGQEELVGKYI